MACRYRGSPVPLLPRWKIAGAGNSQQIGWRGNAFGRCSRKKTPTRGFKRPARSQRAFTCDHSTVLTRPESVASRSMPRAHGKRRLRDCGIKQTIVLDAIHDRDGSAGHIPYQAITTNEREVAMTKPRAVTAKMILEMIERQGRRCALSGKELTPETASLDHVVPLSRGGAHDLTNSLGG